MARPLYPPPPVGVSVKYPGKKARYYGFGHVTGNTCTWPEARAALTAAWAWPGGLLFQSGKFDLDVAEAHLGLPLPAWERTHDTLYLLFLDDPHQAELSLKPAAARLLGMAPEERDAVMEWLLAHQPVPGATISKARDSEHYYGRYISLAPGSLVGTYANGDVDRTAGLFELLWPREQARGMLGAYDRERKLMPILLQMERQGLPVDRRRLRADVGLHDGWLVTLDKWVKDRLRVEDINLDSGDQLIKALVAAGKADPALMPRTATGKLSTSKESLLVGVTDKVLLAVLKHRTQLKTCLQTFMRPWLAVAEASGGLIFTTWNAVRTPAGDANVGTRTGRLSSTPNFQNIPKEFTAIFRHEDPKNKALPACPWPDLPPLPQVRSYLMPFKGEVMIDRDYSQQEPRILAHFDGGMLLQRYLGDPWIDFHDFAKAELARAGLHYERKPVKNTNLGLIYGMGAPKLAAKNGMTVDESKKLRKAVLALYPGLGAMYKDMKIRAANKEPVRTWGGREYYCEAPRIVEGRLRQFDYKLVNVLIQGSAADCTKEAIIRYAAVKAPEARILLNVHDQLTVSVPPRLVKHEMEKLRVAMEGVEFTCPMLSEGATSRTNWAALEDYDRKGALV